jgi:hypothetical protein
MASRSAFLSAGASFLSVVLTSSQAEVEDQKVQGLHDLDIYLGGAVICFVTQWGIRLTILKPLAARFFPGKNRRSVNIKFAQAATEFYTYSFFLFACCKIYYTQPWIWPSKLWWVGKLEGAHSLVTPSFKFLYMLYGGRYLSHLVSVFIEPKRKDFVQMVVHHAVTAILVPLSYCFGYTRIGAAMMLLFDVADPPLHIAKMCKYMADGNVRSRWQFAADCWLKVFALSFFITRCGMYPYIVWAAAFEARVYIEHSKDTPVFFGIYLLHELVALGLLGVLMILQLFWGSILLKVALRDHAEDIRSDDEDDAPDNAPAEKKEA